MSRTTERLTAQITGKGREAVSQEAHARTVLAITGKIHRKAARLRALTSELKRLRRELRRDRTELRIILQRDTTMTLEGSDDLLELAGQANAVDASTSRLER